MNKYLETEALVADDLSDSSDDEPQIYSTNRGASVQESWMLSRTGDTYSVMRAKSKVRNRLKRRSVASQPRQGSIAEDNSEALKINALDEKAETVLLGKAHWVYDKIVGRL